MMAKICFPDQLKIPDQNVMVRSIIKGTTKYPYELKITMDDLPQVGTSRNMYIGLQNYDMDCILWHLKALGLIELLKSVK